MPGIASPWSYNPISSLDALRLDEEKRKVIAEQMAAVAKGGKPAAVVPKAGASGGLPGTSANTVAPLTPVTGAPAPWSGGGATTSNAYTVTTPAPVEWNKVDAPKINYTPANNADWIRATSEMINQINQKAQQDANAGRIPNATGLEAASSGNIASALAGKLSGGTLDLIARQAAERGVAGGSGRNVNANILATTGLRSEELANMGQSWLTAALARNPAAPIYDASKLLITPEQATQFGLDAANFGLNQSRGQFEAGNANANRVMQGNLANVNNQLERDRLALAYQQEQNNVANANAQRQLQADLAAAQNQIERDRIIGQYQQAQFERDNRIKLAEMAINGRISEASIGNSAGNWGGGSGGTRGNGPTSTGTPTPLDSTGGWNDPAYRASLSKLTPPGKPGAAGSQDYVYDPINNYDPENSVSAGNNYDPSQDFGKTQDELMWLYGRG